jgi:hypothetical protein
VECLPSKCEVLNQIPVLPKKEEKKKDAEDSESGKKNEN